MDEEFDKWNDLKKKIQRNRKLLPFREREIWWYAAGENLGSEINGKGKRFSRPILIVRKYGNTTFFGVPLSTKRLSGFWYTHITVNGISRCVLLSQASSFSALRLYEKIDRIAMDEFDEVTSRLSQLLLKK